MLRIIIVCSLLKLLHSYTHILIGSWEEWIAPWGMITIFSTLCWGKTHTSKGFLEGEDLHGSSWYNWGEIVAWSLLGLGEEMHLKDLYSFAQRSPGVTQLPVWYLQSSTWLLCHSSGSASLSGLSPRWLETKRQKEMGLPFLGVVMPRIKKKEERHFFP